MNATDFNYSQNLWLAIGLFAGWLALVVWLTWPEAHCKDCPNRSKRKEDQRP